MGGKVEVEEGPVQGSQHHGRVVQIVGADDVHVIPRLRRKWTPLREVCYDMLGDVTLRGGRLKRCGVRRS